MSYFFRRKPSSLTFEDVMRDLNNIHHYGTDHLKDLNECFNSLKSLITRFKMDSTEFECKKCRKSGTSFSKPDDDNRKTVETFRKENGELKKQNEDLQGKLSDVTMEKRKLENELESNNREKHVSFQNIDVINKELGELERVIKSCSEEQGYGTNVDLSIDKRIAILRDQETQWRDSMKKRVSSLEKDIEKLHNELKDRSKQYETKLSLKSEEYKNILQNRLDENELIKSELRLVRGNNDKQDAEIQDKSDKINSLEKICNDLDERIQEQCVKIADRESKFLEKQEEIKQMRQQLSIVQSECDESKRQCIGLSNKLDSERSRLFSLNEKLSQQNANIERIRNEKDTLFSENEELKSRIEELLRKRKGNVQISIHSVLKPSLSEQAIRELMSRMTERLERDEVELDHRLYNNSDDVKGPLVVLCINVSRLGTDVKEALKGVSKGIQDVAMLVLHHKETHALPSQSSDRILTGPEYKQLGIIIDLAFLSNRGLYQCEMNNKAIERFASFLLQYKKDS